MLYTLAAPGTYQEDIRKSRFIVFAEGVQSPAEALSFIARHRVASASHNCWAYRIGTEYRFNDDGEPGGTAGRPILQAIEGQQCDRVAVLVARWFGGIKLGPGGLMRAYGGSAAQCLRLADRVELLAEILIDCCCTFAEMALIQSRFPAFHVRIENEIFDANGVQWRLVVPQDLAQSLGKLFANLTRGQGQWRIAPTPQVDL
ncbi:IMPACT family protein [Paralcaligenes sp. KSB-10]|uniref:IMPACT family protein n=1 Tax=Paralcaligenes sp. KSB-10 TaxID=2901142 RepID=UPI001E3B7538|nr:YigZ family protein [Paralcaligenes sp. KSB-10]UHL66211.1 IMPACT family protein [Paralcaligenes sp. KSB-10]